MVTWSNFTDINDDNYKQAGGALAGGGLVGVELVAMQYLYWTQWCAQPWFGLPCDTATAFLTSTFGDFPLLFLQLVVGAFITLVGAFLVEYSIVINLCLGGLSIYLWTLWLRPVGGFQGNVWPALGWGLGVLLILVNHLPAVLRCWQRRAARRRT